MTSSPRAAAANSRASCSSDEPAKLAVSCSTRRSSRTGTGGASSSRSSSPAVISANSRSSSSWCSCDAAQTWTGSCSSRTGCSSGAVMPRPPASSGAGRRGRSTRRRRGAPAACGVRRPSARRRRARRQRVLERQHRPHRLAVVAAGTTPQDVDEALDDAQAPAGRGRAAVVPRRAGPPGTPSMASTRTHCSSRLSRRAKSLRACSVQLVASSETTCAAVHAVTSSPQDLSVPTVQRRASGTLAGSPRREVVALRTSGAYGSRQRARPRAGGRVRTSPRGRAGRHDAEAPCTSASARSSSSSSWRSSSSSARTTKAGPRGDRPSSCCGAGAGAGRARGARSGARRAARTAGTAAAAVARGPGGVRRARRQHDRLAGHGDLAHGRVAGHDATGRWPRRRRARAGAGGRGPGRS